MKIIKIKKTEDKKTYQIDELQDLEKGCSLSQDFELVVENDDNKPEQKYLGTIVLKKMEENQGKTKRRFAIKKLKPISE